MPREPGALLDDAALPRTARPRTLDDAALPRTARPRRIATADVDGDGSDRDGVVQDAARRGCGRGLRR